MPFLPSQITRYVTARSLMGVLTALFVLSALIVLINFVELSRTTSGARGGEASASEVIGLALLQSPGVILRILPFTFLFGVLGAFMNLNRRSELVALRASGVSAWRFVTPAAVTAALIGVLAMAAFNPLAATMTSQFERMKTELTRSPNTPNNQPIWLRQGDKRQQIVIRALSNVGPGVHLKGVTMFVNAVEPDGRLRFVRRIEASDAVLQHDTWTLSNVREFTPGGIGVAGGTLQMRSTLSEATALERFTANTAIAFWTLPGLIARTESAGISATIYRLQFQQLLATPLMYAGMAMLAAAFSLRLLRLGGLVQLAASGVALGFVFFFFNEICSALGRSEALPVTAAAWAPPALALLAGITLLCFTEDG